MSPARSSPRARKPNSAPSRHRIPRSKAPAATVGVDVDGDGIVDMDLGMHASHAQDLIGQKLVGQDLDGDGVMDLVGIDVDGDGKVILCP